MRKSRFTGLCSESAASGFRVGAARGRVDVRMLRHLSGAGGARRAAAPHALAVRRRAQGQLAHPASVFSGRTNPSGNNQL